MGSFAFFFEGDVYVEIATSPTGYESLYVGQNCDLSSCGQRVTGTIAAAVFVSGTATFEVSNSTDFVFFINDDLL